jgi:hypothetical protein
MSSRTSGWDGWDFMTVNLEPMAAQRLPGRPPVAVYPGRCARKPQPATAIPRGECGEEPRVPSAGIPRAPRKCRDLGRTRPGDKRERTSSRTGRSDSASRSLKATPFSGVCCWPIARLATMI